LREESLSSNDTIFHKIIRREIPADIVYEDAELIAFRDINPVSPVHILVIPKKTIPSLSSAAAEDQALLGKMLLCCCEIARTLGIDQSGYRVIINNGEEAGQAVFQLHMHLVGGRKFAWPPG
jgi:histidine triad (HIT) family protein